MKSDVVTIGAAVELQNRHHVRGNEETTSKINKRILFHVHELLILYNAYT